MRKRKGSHRSREGDDAAGAPAARRGRGCRWRAGHVAVGRESGRRRREAQGGGRRCVREVGSGGGGRGAITEALLLSISEDCFLKQDRVEGERAAGTG